MKEYNIDKSVNAQKEYVKETQSPHFAPTSGRCWSCSKNIYKEYSHINLYTQSEYSTGIDVEQAGRALVTGCPHCNRSYCD
jgi:hypothetical protein